jgi:alpha-1,2-glucosyltransferase
MNAPHLGTSLTRAFRYLIPFVLLLIPLWQMIVNAVVPEPYLDEVFHVGQAQAYWSHKWKHWDPKITTPPGLYLWSYFLCASLLHLRGSPKEVGAAQLRATNVAAASILLPFRLQTLLDHLRKERNTRPVGAWVSHTVLNICLFPPLFFFSALYYTDILALLFVVEAYIWDIQRSANTNRGKTWSSVLAGHASIQTLIFLVTGLTALLFRQTNIFWVAVFLGGLQVVRTLRETSTPCNSSSFNSIVNESLRHKLYDPPLTDASVIGELLL